MKLSELLDMWKADAVLDASNLSKESERIPALHGKYLDLYTMYRMKLKVMELELKRLNLEKHEYLLQGPSRETKEKGWVYPTSGKIVRQDIELYRNADKQVQELELKHENAKVFVEALTSILDAIKQRGFIVGNAIKREMFIGGM